MTVAVQQPTSRRGDDILDVIGKAVGIATQLYGVKMNKDQADFARKLAQEKQDVALAEKERQSKGLMTPGEENKMFSSGRLLPSTPEQGGIQVGRRMSGEPIFGKPSSVAAAEISKGAELAKIADTKRARNMETIAKSEKEVRTDSEIMKHKDALNAADRVEALVAQESPILDATALRQIFRLSGDVGVIREQDLRDLGSSPSVVERFKQWAGQASEGQRITDEARRDIVEMTNIMRQVASKKIKDKIGSMSKSLAAQVNNLDQDEALELLMQQVTLPEVAPPMLQRPPGQGGPGVAYGATQQQGQQQKYFDVDQYLED